MQHLIVVAGPEDRPIYDHFLAWLAQSGVEVDYLIDLIPGRTDLFQGAQRALTRLPVSRRTVVGESEWFESLFSSEVAKNYPKLEQFSAADPLSECEWTVRKCLELIESGTPAASIAVMIRDAELYSPLLVHTCERLELPVDLVRSVPLLSSGFAHVVLQSLKACASRDVRLVARLGKNSYCKTKPEEFWKLWESASHLSRGGQDGWAGLAIWLSESEIELPWLRTLMAWRSESAEGKFSLSKWLDRLRKFVGDTAMSDACAESSPHLAARDLRAQTVLQGTIADLAFVYDQAGHSELTLQQFVKLAERVWSEETVTVRSEGTGVKVCFDPSSLMPLDTVFVLGMLEGTMPRRRSEDPLLTDEERSQISRLVGVRLMDSRDHAREERDHFVRICASVQTRLVLSYPQVQDDRENIPAFYLEELKRVVGGNVQESQHPRHMIVPDEAECRTDAEKRLRQLLDSERTYTIPPRLSRDWSKKLVAPDWSKSIRPEEIGRALVCPFQSTFLYRLKLEQPLRKLGTWILLDLPRKARLASASSRASAISVLHDCLDDLLDRVSPNLEEYEVDLMRSTGSRFIKDWVEREFLSRELWSREQSLSDIRLGEEGLRDSPKVDETRSVRLTGAVAGLTVVVGLSVAQFYEPDRFKVDSFLEDVTAQEDALVYGIYLMTQSKRTGGGAALEIDSTNGSRSLAVLSSRDLALRSDAGKGFYVRNLGESPGRIIKAVCDRMSEGMRVIESASAKADPGEHCTRCRYGELCRVSIEFGEETSPFGVDDRP